MIPGNEKLTSQLNDAMLRQEFFNAAKKLVEQGTPVPLKFKVQNKYVEVEFTITEVPETDAEKIKRLEEELVSQKVILKLYADMIARRDAPKPSEPWIARGVLGGQAYGYAVQAGDLPIKLRD